MRYKILGADSSYSLMIKVESYIKRGWIPQGGVSVVYEETIRRYRFYQSIVKIDIGAV